MARFFAVCGFCRVSVGVNSFGLFDYHERHGFPCEGEGRVPVATWPDARSSVSGEK